MKKIFIFCLFTCFFASSTQAYDMKDLNRTFDKSYKCKKGDQKCKNREHLKGAARVAAVAVAVKLIADMVIEHRSKKIKDEEAVAAEYKKDHQQLPNEAFASAYVTNTLPGKVVEPGNKVTVKSDIVVVPGTKEKSTLIEEKMSIYDNEDHTKELKSLTKSVNQKSKKAGSYENEFSFTLPEGVPQGEYPIKTELLLNGKVVKSSDTGIQLVLRVDQQGQMQIAMLN
jgi:hypothetical protein